jgi:hypothetical protein
LLGSGLAACESAADQDLVSENACRHFYNVAADAGILSTEELRGKLQEVNSTASSGEDRAVRDAARDLLSAITNGDVADFESAVSDMDEACTPYIPEEN